MRKLSFAAATLAAGFLFLGVPGAAQACPSTGLFGTYTTTFTGKSFGHTLSVSGVLGASGGVLSASLTQSYGGSIRALTGSGSYTANVCSGSATLNLSNGSVVHFNFSVNAAGNAFIGTETDPGTIVTIQGSM
jgi:hypothetical protein